MATEDGIIRINQTEIKISKDDKEFELWLLGLTEDIVLIPCFGLSKDSKFFTFGKDKLDFYDDIESHIPCGELYFNPKDQSFKQDYALVNYEMQAHIV
jgi:hypothetical protein